jgi:hypothetical protein
MRLSELKGRPSIFPAHAGPTASELFDYDVTLKKWRCRECGTLFGKNHRTGGARRHHVQQKHPEAIR